MAASHLYTRRKMCNVYCILYSVYCILFLSSTQQHISFGMYDVLAILLTKTTAVQNEVALSYHRVRGLCFQAVIFGETIIISIVLPKFYIPNDSYLR